MELYAGDSGLASANSTEVWVAHNTICHNTGADIVGEGGFSGFRAFHRTWGAGTC
jgi:hypothetical protein